MQSKKLGKGLGELLGELEGLPEKAKDNTVISIDDISVNPYQPRKYFDKLKIKELADSIKEHGLLQPILVVQSGDSFILIAGERRLRAVKLNGNDEVKAIVLEYELSYIKELSLIENIQREDLNALEIAKSYSELIDEYNITHEQLALRVKKSRSSITNTIRLLQLPDFIQDKIYKNEMSAGQSKVLIGLEESEQKDLVDLIIKDKLPSSAVEKIVKDIKRQKNLETNKEDTKPQKTSHDKNISHNDKITSANNILSKKNIQSSILNNKLIITFDNSQQIDDFLSLIQR